MRRVRKAGLAALGVLLVLLMGAGAAWALRARDHYGRVARNVALAGHPIGGMTRTEVEKVVADLAARVPTAIVRVEADGRGFTTTAAELGVTVDRDATVAAALRAGRSGSLPGRVASWLWGFVHDRPAGMRVDVATVDVYDAVRRLDQGRTDAVEPSLTVKDGRLLPVPGRNGRGVDAGDVVRELHGALSGGGRRVTVHVDRGTVPPRFGVDRARALAARAEQLVDGGLRVRAGGESATVSASALRTWLTTRAGATDLELAVDRDAAGKGLAALLPHAGRDPVNAGFGVTGGGVTITPARDGTACCAPDAADRVLDGLVGRDRPPVELPLKTVQPKRTTDEARKLKITELVSTFTTPHKCCEARVRNIHRIADLLRGHVIEPGETFSVNDTVGKRTTAKGFVSAPVIENGQHSEDVGGGISQFATTMFNAAWFAGLEFGEYQSHSLYISRYPYGREATMGYPHPDLEVKNITPYGILIWPTYTERSLTVTLYSTKYFQSVAMSNQTKQPQGTCTVVRSERTRVLFDGTKKVDSTSARYRAAEGLNCDGSKAPPPTSKGA